MWWAFPPFGRALIIPANGINACSGRDSHDLRTDAAGAVVVILAEGRDVTPMRRARELLREELEDHAFRWLNPEAHVAVVERLKVLRERNQGLINEIETALTTKLEEAKVGAIVARARRTNKR